MMKQELSKKVQAKIFLDDFQEQKATRTISDIRFAVADEIVYEIVKAIFALQKYEVDRIMLVETYNVHD